MILFLNLVVYVCLSFVAGFYTSSLRVSAWLLGGLHSYLYPDAPPGQEVQGGRGLKATKIKEVQSSKNGEKVGEGTQEVPSGVEAKFSAHKAGEKPYAVLRRTEQKRKEKLKDKFRV
ncbi:hypothetical protein GOP47_0029465 [Adiantum capillus-veneris]|nr:hypothetical protein GOP47_0029465 [Adiantum capillus-veneris]